MFPEIIQKSCSCPEASRLASILLRSRLVPLLKVSLLYPRLKMCFAIYTFTRAYDSINLINFNFITGFLCQSDFSILKYKVGLATPSSV